MNQSRELLESNETSNWDHLRQKNSTQYLEKLKTENPQGLMKSPQKFGRPEN